MEGKKGIFYCFSELEIGLGLVNFKKIIHNIHQNFNLNGRSNSW
jgi:hypothetical protein